MAIFTVSSQKEISIVIEIFNNSPLNTTKHLNFLDFKKAFYLYINTTKKTLNLKKEIDNIKNGMNNERSYFEMPANHIKITSYWLLGFVEGEGSFFISKSDNYRIGFGLGQSSKDLILMEEIKNFFNNLSGEFPNKHDYGNVVSFSTIKPSVHQSYGMINLLIQNKQYITNVLIPFYDSMVWISKKEYDYKDWKIILNLKQLGLHYTKEGIKVIDQILSQTNNNRLSTNKQHVTVDRTLLQIEIDKLLSGPSNFEKKTVEFSLNL
uniref:hypothetical protein n=1 Tax=Drechslerella dactyloides TaxID=74499 RepID=UPI0022FD883B|nr:hypothetical protein PNX16_mgp031 [Drechslerella dactyloides]WAN89820.1 hypothetical protein [Drechslerella dactyloides]